MPQNLDPCLGGSGRIRLFTMQQKQFREAKINNKVPCRECPDGCWDTVSPRDLGRIMHVNTTHFLIGRNLMLFCFIWRSTVEMKESNHENFY